MHQYHMLICCCKCVNMFCQLQISSTNYNSFSKAYSFVCFWLILKQIKSKSVSTQRHLFQNKTYFSSKEMKRISHNILKAMHLKKTSWTGCSNNIQCTIRLVKKLNLTSDLVVPVNKSIQYLIPEDLFTKSFKSTH